MINKFKKSKWTSTLLAVILITSVGLVGLTGCKVSTNKVSNNNTPALSNPISDTENKGTTAKTETQQETNNQSNTNTAKPAQSTTAPANETKEVFYGQWVIKQVLAYGSVGTYSKKDAESLLGKSLSFSTINASHFGDQPSEIDKVATKPVYKKTVISKGDFVTNYRMTLEKLGIKADSISEVTVSDSKGTVCIFLIKDDNTLIITGGGTYFELVRK
jgi:bla regulator protein blaR1